MSSHPPSESPAPVANLRRFLLPLQLAYPTLACPVEPVVPLAGRLAASFARWPSASRLPGIAATLTQAALECRLPLVSIDPDSGRVLGVRELAVGGPGVAVTVARDSVAVATAGRVFLLKSP